MVHGENPHTRCRKIVGLAAIRVAGRVPLAQGLQRVKLHLLESRHVKSWRSSPSAWGQLNWHRGRMGPLFGRGAGARMRAGGLTKPGDVESLSGLARLLRCVQSQVQILYVKVCAVG